MDTNTTPDVLPVLPARLERSLGDHGLTPDDLLSAARSDLDISGDFAESWVLVTQDRVLVFLVDHEDDRALLQREIPVRDISAARTDSRVGSGFLEIKTDSVFEELARFSNRNADKFAKVAAQIKLLAEGKPVDQLPPVPEEPDDPLKRHGIEKPAQGAVFFRFLARTKSYWPYTAMAMVFVVTTILLQLVPAQLTRILIDNVFGDHPLPPWFATLTTMLGVETRIGWLVALVVFLAVVILITATVGVFRERLSVSISTRLGYELRRDMFIKLEDLAIRYHDTHPVGRLMTRCTQDVETLQTFIPQLTSGFGYQIILVIAVVVVMFTMSWKLTLFALFPAPFVMMCTYLFTKHVTPAWRKFWTTRSSLSNGLHGALHGIRVVKAFAQEGREAQRFDKLSSAYKDAGLYVGYANAVFYPFAGFLFQLGGFVVWMYGGYRILTPDPDGAEMTIGALVAFLGYLGMFYAPLNSLTQMSTWFTQFVTQAHRVFEVLDESPEIREIKDALDVEIQGNIRMDNVTFGYDPHIPVLQDVTLDVRQGEMIGIVGHSGCGKSTLVNLILRFYDTQNGRIFIDDTDITRIKKTCLRRQIGLVAQDPFLFPGTIAENIAYGNPCVSPELVLNAAIAANAHMFIVRAHDGYDARLGERGAGLSGGERQRVAIARALLHNPRILILDEATSAVDAISEREIQHALEALSLGRTTIAIAHRLSTLRNCDRIIVFEEGRIREQGSHHQLLAIDGIYRKLVDIQSQMSDRVDVLHAATSDEPSPPVQTKDLRAERSRLAVPQVKYLDPLDLRAFSRDEGGMRVEYKDQVHEHVRAYRCFPISRPQEFIALWIGDSTLEHHEIGMIRRLKEVAPSSRLAVEHELAKRYFIHYIREIRSIKEDLAFLLWDVITDRGEMTFYTHRWERDTVSEGGANGRIILDLDNNRFEIEDMDQLDAASRATFLKYIYW